MPWLRPLLLRLHFYAGLLVGPFILIAALSGGAYAISAQVEKVIYDEQLHASTRTTAFTVAEQVAIAQQEIPELPVAAVRPAPNPGDTTRVLFADPDLGSSETRAIFVDPGTGEVRGDLTSYGTSGALPLRNWIDQLHRGLHLGDVGRIYSELAASWLWVVASAGVVLWVLRFRRTRHRLAMVRPESGKGYRGALSWHTSLGLWLAVAAMFLSATGITWSQFGGTHVSDLRSALSWTSPTVSRDLAPGGPDRGPVANDPHAEHTGAPAATLTGELGRIDGVLAVARTANIDVGEVEVRPPTDQAGAWLVQEIRRSYPTAVDAVAIDGQRLTVTDQVDFADHPFPAKLARWGIDIHMGSMWGLPNQIVLLVVALGIAGSVISGYAMWWRRRPTRRGGLARPPARGAITEAPWWAMAGLAILAAGVGAFLPMVGISLIGFLIIDLITGISRRRAAS